MLPHTLEFAPQRDQEIFASAPSGPAVFLLRPESGEPYVSKTANLRRRLLRLLGPAEEHSRRLNLRDRARQIEYAATGSDFESGLLLYRTLRQEFPQSYPRRVRLRPAPLLKLDLDNPYPRASITAQWGSTRRKSLYYGPFATRAAAEKFMNDALDFFKVRRCVEDLRPDPAFPGCIYSEMKMCLAPCFRGCTDPDYARETARVQAFFDTRGQSLRRELAEQRERASEGLAFEEAAGLHAQWEKVSSALAPLPEITRRLDLLDALMVQPSAEPGCVALFRIAQGCFSHPVHLPVAGGSHAAAPAAEAHAPEKPAAGHISMEARISRALASAPAFGCGSRAEAAEHLAILKRWYFRSSKVGEIFFAESGELPLRRVVRAVGRVFRGEKPAPELHDSAKDYWINRAREAEV